MRAGAPVVGVTRDDDGVTIRTTDGAPSGSTPWSWRPTRTTRWRPWATPTTRERAALGGFEYNRNQVVLHTDERVMPRRHDAWSSWNVDQAACNPPGGAVTMTYHMNRLQSLPGPTQYFISVNPGDRVRDDRVILAREFSHPLYTFQSLRSQAAIRELQGHRSHLVRGRPPRLRVPRGRLPVRIRGRRAHRCGRGAGAGAGGMRSHLLEGKVRHRRASPVDYALEHYVYYAALDLRSSTR